MAKDADDAVLVRCYQLSERTFIAALGAQHQLYVRVP
jgi:hypothetical protein